MAKTFTKEEFEKLQEITYFILGINIHTNESDDEIFDMLESNISKMNDILTAVKDRELNYFVMPDSPAESKSSIAKEIAKKMGHEYIDLRM